MTAHTRRVSLLLGLAGVLFSACVDPGKNTDDSHMMSDEPLLTYTQDAKPLLDHYCADCHAAGGIAPITLTDHASVKAAASAIAKSVTHDRMPPWLPTEQGVDLRYARRMRPEDKQRLLTWLKQGAALGPADAPPRVVLPPRVRPAPARQDLLLDIGDTYQPGAKSADDYRCFVIDPGSPTQAGLPEAKYLRAGEVLPDNKAIVHHVVVFEIDAAHAADAKAKDAAESGPGYTCFGGAGVAGSQITLAWAVGGEVNRLADNQGTLLNKGSVFVVQLHYNLANYRGVGDRTRVRFEFAPTPPEYDVRYLPLLYPPGVQIKAGDPQANQVIAAPVSQILKFLKLPGLTEVTITSAFPHMHVLGKTITTSLNSQTLLDIANWQFGWQQTYFLSQPVLAKATDLLTLTCQWDNSPANQPVIDGKQQPPKDVRFGEGTGDEMCVTLLGVQIRR